MQPTKACPVVLRGSAKAREILVFRHPLAGIQLVKGSIKSGESVEAAAVRELLEEAGVVAVAGKALGIWNADHEAQVWAFQLCQAAMPLSEQWTHVCADDGGHAFAFFWMGLDAASLEGWHPVHARALAHLRILLQRAATGA